MNKTLKLLCALLAVLMLTALLPAAAFAEITKVEPPLQTWVEVDAEGKPHVFAIPGEWNGEVLCNGNPGELVDIKTDAGTQTIYIRNNIDDQFLYINEIWAKRIRNAEENGALKINAENWYTLNVYVAEAIAERQDVSVEFDYPDYPTDARLSLTIPAGTDLAALMDGKETISFKDLAEKLAPAAPAAEEAPAAEK